MSGSDLSCGKIMRQRCGGRVGGDTKETRIRILMLLRQARYHATNQNKGVRHIFWDIKDVERIKIVDDFCGKWVKGKFLEVYFSVFAGFVVVLSAKTGKRGLIVGIFPFCSHLSPPLEMSALLKSMSLHFKRDTKEREIIFLWREC